MSAITINGDLVHYEVLGRGRPVIFLHSWLGSWRYWIPTMQQLSVKYRTYALDLWGFGDSGRNNIYYGIEGQAELLQNFMDRMGIPKAVFVGHGLGAAVLAYFATKPECREIVHRMFVISPPLFGRSFVQGASTPPAILPTASPAAPSAPQSTPSLPTASIDTGSFAVPQVPTDPKPSAKPDVPDILTVPSSSTDAPTIARISKADRERLLLGISDSSYFATKKPADTPATPPAPVPPTTPEDSAPKATIPGMEGSPNPLLNTVGKTKPAVLLSRHMDTSSSDYEKLRTEVEKADDEALQKSVQSLSRYNTMYHLIQAKAPTLALLGATDTFVTLPSEAILNQLTERNECRVIIMPNTRHFPMLEDVTRFTRLLRDFFEAPDLDELEMKDEWRRRTR